jgi:hypothetical protein
MSSHFPPKSPQSKLAIRTSVLSAIQTLSDTTVLSTSEQQAIVDELQRLNAPDVVQDILAKELLRASDRKQLDTIGELLTRLGRLEDLHDTLWQIIENPDSSDIVKDTANMVLRQLGDRAEPEKYMHFLDDPEELIEQEMIRTLELSMTEPQALVDFIDFIVSLKPDSQQQLLDTLRQDFNPHARTQLYQAILESLPSKALSQIVVHNLGETGTVQAARVLLRMRDWPDEKRPCPIRPFETALKKLQLAGVYHPERGVVDTTETAHLHTLVQHSKPHQSFATIADGLGNQGLLLSRKQEDGQYCLLGVALHDKHGIMDCFGFQDLSARDVQRFIERFYDSGLKTPVPEHYFAYKVLRAENATLTHYRRLPYEYRAWSVLMGDIEPQKPDLTHALPQWTDPNWQNNTGQLYQHPEFRHWFTEFGDLMFTNDIFKAIGPILNSDSPIETRLKSLSTLADELALTLQNNSPWVTAHQQRLMDAAWLLEQQHVDTFRNLAATAAVSLQDVLDDPKRPLAAFTQAYAKKSILEGALRHYKTQPTPNTDWDVLLQELKGQFGV